MIFLHVAPLLAFTNTVAAFSLTFYVGDQCRGERLGGFDVSIEDNCVPDDLYSTASSSVTITRQDGDQLDHMLYFFEGDTCDINNPANPVAAGNTGCINVGFGRNDFAAVRVFGGGGSPQQVASRRTRTAGNRRVAPRRARSVGELQHGDVFEQDGKDYRWQQIARGTFTGVPTDKWDTAFRVMNDEPLIFNASYPFNFEEYYMANPNMAPRGRTQNDSPGVSLAERPDAMLVPELLPFCRRAYECVVYLPWAASIYFPAQTEYVVNAIEAARTQATLENLWNFLLQPVIIPIGTGVATGYISAQHFSSGSASEVPSTCSQAEDTAVLAALINSGAVTEDQVNAVRAEIYDSNAAQAATIAVAIVPEYVNSGNQICGAPIMGNTLVAASDRR
jgi:hypothetical protein